MPLYEYQCASCNKRFTLLQKVGISEKDTACPFCGSKEVRKLLSAFACFGSEGPAAGFPSYSGGGGG